MSTSRCLLQRILIVRTRICTTSNCIVTMSSKWWNYTKVNTWRVLLISSLLFVLNVINLSFILDEQLTSLSKACYCHIRQLHYIRLNLDLSTACTIAKFWMVAFDNLSQTNMLCYVIATSIVNSKLDYCSSFYHRLFKSQLSRLQQTRTLFLVLLLKLLSPVISLPSYALFTRSGSLKASNTSSSHLPTKLTQPSPTFISS